MKRIILLATLAFFLTGCGKTSDADARAIESNLEQLSMAALQCMLETGKAEIRYSDLVGDKPTHFFREVKALNGESYHGLVFTHDTKSVSVSTKDGRTITYRLAP